MGFKVITKKMVEAAEKTRGGTAPCDKLENYWGSLVKYIPAPMIAGYKIAEEMFLAAGRTSEMPLVFILFLAITPLAVAAIAREGATLTMEYLRSIKVQIVMATLAFIIWIMSTSRWLTVDPLWGTVFLLLFTIGAPALGKDLSEKNL